MTDYSARTLRQMHELEIRLRSNPNFMSWVLDTYQKQEHILETDVIHVLGITPEMFYRLALCKRPDSSSPEFTEEIRQLAHYTSIDPTQLANLVRRVEALDKFKTIPNQLEKREDTQSVSPSIGLLAVARDQDEKEDSEQRSDEAQEDNSESETSNKH
jgi:hypothetical protein